MMLYLVVETLHCVVYCIAFEISENDVLRSINRLRNNSSCGPDGLPPVLFKRLKHRLRQPLALMYNQLFCRGTSY